MKKAPILLLLFSVFIFSQNQRFIYEYKFNNDSTNIQDINLELMNLDVTSKGSKFYSYDKRISDSLRDEAMIKAIKSGLDLHTAIPTPRKHSVYFEIEKKYPQYEVYYINYVNNIFAKVKDERELDWKITKEKKKIGSFDTQKATLNFAGRTWNAWFAQKIPIQDGPYKFHGLPGLIIMISDTTNSHIFELKGIKKFVESEERNEKTIGNHTIVTRTKPVDINMDKYVKLFKQSRLGPAPDIDNGSSETKYYVAGKEVSKREFERGSLERHKAFILKNNNILELDLLK